ncbi:MULTISPECIES: response regulator [unclassified Caballeronia]|uniref:response regulator n=1 Tax=unclassified Caballeronia TaxID=2646786 RepID=UPI00202780C6|nr:MULTISPECIES: response regulator [unclassified Caballeronia]
MSIQRIHEKSDILLSRQSGNMMENWQKTCILVTEAVESYRFFLTRALGIELISTSLHVDTAASLAEMESVLRGQNAPYALAVCDLDLLGTDGTTLTRLVADYQFTPLVVYSASDDLRVPQRALNTGASGFFRRDSPATLITQVVDIVLGAEAFALPSYLRPL